MENRKDSASGKRKKKIDTIGENKKKKLLYKIKANDQQRTTEAHTLKLDKITHESGMQQKEFKEDTKNLLREFNENESIMEEHFKIDREESAEDIEIKKEVTFDKTEENDVSILIETEAEKRQYKEYYLDGYCLRDNGSEQYYAKDYLGDEIYWRDSVNTEIYAYKIKKENSEVHRFEYPAMKNGKPNYIYDRAGKPRYPVNLTNNDIIFPRDPVTNEEVYLLDKMGNLFYPENKYGRQFYRKDAEGNEVVINNTYAQYANGTQIYPKKANGDNFYIEIDNKEIPALKKVDKTLKPYYAEKANKEQIYPREYLEESSE